MANSTFDTDDDFHFNACVGNNGWVDHATYSDGFDEAVTALCQVVLLGGTADTLIYPIVFCARHRIELFVKSKLRRVGHIRKDIAIPDDKIIKTHDLGILWALLENMTKQCDSRYAELIDSCRPAIMDFFEMDPKGETFRYPYSQDGVKHLTEQSLIGLRRFTGAYTDLTDLMRKIEMLSDFLYSEYATNTYTKVLSRQDLESIATELPPRSMWGDPEGTFPAVKAKIIARHNLSGRQYTDALNVIQGHREFSQLIGIDNTLPHCDPVKLQQLFQLRFNLNQYSGSFPESFTPQYKDAYKKYIDFLSDQLSDEELATILALNELGSNIMNYSEHYDGIYEEHLLSIQYHKRSQVTYIQSRGAIQQRIFSALKVLRQENILMNLAVK
ncbi:hypothetical protein L6228_15325 [Pseudomonas syringae pv. syringae]|uniref:hypothetical protein n=1 Tax=Pseudomonas syringae TaxID=317 RepID=UPI001F0EFA9C|nr:hypothetical protein [Pseudomonas syringae]MCH5633871.1 hypothetical protein [Pseudomonas syringae pv. syringae]